MRWWAALVGAVVSAILTTVCLADVRITGNSGGEVTLYIDMFEEMRASGERLIIDGPCLSACTLFTAILPRRQVCITRRAVLGFHAASYYDDARHSLVPTRAGTRLVMRLYPPQIHRWIERHGGLTTNIIAMRSRELAELYNSCR